MLHRRGALFKGLCWRFIMKGCDYGNSRSAKALLFGQHDLAFQKEAFKERQTTPSHGLRVQPMGDTWLESGSTGTSRRGGCLGVDNTVG